jgi:dTDP-4-dehydrorhamnose reductase
LAPKRVLITGLGGTLAPRAAMAARWRGWQVQRWDRQAVDPDDTPAARRWLDAERPDAMIHFALGSPAWAALLAEDAARRGAPFVHISTALVFDHEPDGPHAPGDLRNARGDYGRLKIATEDAVAAANAGASIVRIGWQIDATLPGHNMLVELDGWQARDGRIGASRAWRPACSFVDDTAAVLIDLIERPQPGVVPIDSNAAEGHSFEAIVRALQCRYARWHWQIAPNDDYRHDQRQIGGEQRVPGLSARLELGQ